MRKTAAIGGLCKDFLCFLWFASAQKQTTASFPIKSEAVRA
jgi:hypothetical protein